MSSIETKFSSGCVSIKDAVENGIWQSLFDFFKDYYAVYRGNKLLCYKERANFKRNELPSVTYDLTSVTLTTTTYERNELYQIDVWLSGRTEPIFIRAHRETLQWLLNTIPTHPELKQTPVGQRSYPPPLMKQGTTQGKHNVGANYNNMSSTETKFSSGCVSIEDVVENKYWNVFFDFFKDYYAVYRGNKLLCYKERANFKRNELPSVTYDLTSVTLTTTTYERNELYQIDVWLSGRTEPIFIRAHRETLQWLLNTIPTHPELKQTPVGQLSYPDYPPLMQQGTSQGKHNAEILRIEEIISILNWCQNLTKGFGVDIANFNESWKDGRALVAFIGALRPGTVDLCQFPSADDLNSALEIAIQAFALKQNYYNIYTFQYGNNDRIYEFVKSIYYSCKESERFAKKEENVSLGDEMPPDVPVVDRMSEEERIVLTWCQQQTAKYEDIKVENFEESWTDGLVLNALVHSMRPEFIDMKHVREQSRWNRIEDVLDTIYAVFQMQAVIDVEDMLNGNKGQIFKLVNSLYEHHNMIYGHMDVLTSDEEAVEPEVVSRTQLEEALADCAVCFDTFENSVTKKPTVGACGHSICVACREALRLSNQLKCPLCNQENSFIKETINYQLMEMLEKLDVLAGKRNINGSTRTKPARDSK